MTPTEAVAGRVRQLRRTRGWTAEELAERMTEVGIPWNQPVVSRLETGKRETVTLAEVLALAYVFDVAPIHLFVPTDPGEAEYQVVPTREIAVHAAREWVRGEAPLPGGDVRQYFSEVPVEEYVAAANAYTARQAEPVARPQQRRRMTRKLLREVAEVYRAALAEGEAPTKAVAEHFTVSHRTAGRWVGETRKVGELGPAVGPTSGELSGDRT